jgi:cytochrome P450
VSSVGRVPGTGVNPDTTTVAGAVALVVPSLDLRALAVADPYPALAAAREAAPIVADSARGGWLLCRHAEIAAALRDRRLGRVDPAAGPSPRPGCPAFSALERWSLLDLEGPDHERLRTRIGRLFTPSAVAARRPAIETLAADLLEPVLARLRDGDAVDLLADYAGPFAVSVICDLLGVPRADGPRLLAWSHAMVRLYEVAPSPEHRAAAESASVDFAAYVDGLPDVLGAIGVSPAERRSTVVLLLNAGHEATVNALGNGLRALLSRPDQWHRLAGGTVDAASALEECLRFDGPLMLFDRIVIDPDGIELAGHRLGRGERVGLLFGAANRDPRRFDDPDRFDVGRGDAGHVGFGGGAHFCLGAPLARMELAVSLAALAARAPDLALAAEPEFHPTFVIRGLRALPVVTTR